MFPKASVLTNQQSQPPLEKDEEPPAIAYPPSEVCITDSALSPLFPPYVRVHVEDASTETAQLQTNETTRTMLKSNSFACNKISHLVFCVMNKKDFLSRKFDKMKRSGSRNFD
jgi:hypothetical protein